MLQTLAPNLFVVDSTLAMPGAKLPLRSTLVKLESGGLLVHSPVQFDAATVAEINAHGEVRVLVAPSALHHRFLPSAQSLWPAAESWAPAAVRTKSPTLKISHAFGEAEWPYAPELRAFPLLGAPKVQEVVFLHASSQSLIVTDLVFNILEPQGIMAGLIFRIFGTYKHFDSSRLYRGYIADKPAFAASLEPVLSQDFSRIIMAHGAPVEGDDLPSRLRAVTRRLC